MKYHHKRQREIYTEAFEGDPTKVINYLQSIIDENLVEPSIYFDYEYYSYSHDDLRYTKILLNYWEPFTEAEIKRAKEKEAKAALTTKQREEKAAKDKKIASINKEIRTLKHVNKQFGYDISKELAELEEKLEEAKK